jgi:hypothetical protein
LSKDIDLAFRARTGREPMKMSMYHWLTLLANYNHNHQRIGVSDLPYLAARSLVQPGGRTKRGNPMGTEHIECHSMPEIMIDRDGPEERRIDPFSLVQADGGQDPKGDANGGR